MIKHYPNCRADYPEKPKNERPQQIETEALGDGYVLHYCVDCGAEVVERVLRK